jgi:hypothetical protein
MEAIAYLFGSTPTEFYIEHQDELSANELAEVIAKMDFDTFYYDENTHPSELLVQYGRWDDFTEITDELYDLLTKHTRHAETVLIMLKDQYITSDVVSGEFIYSAEIPSVFTEAEVRYGIQQFLDWDESPATFELEANEPHWIIKETNSQTS